jgi:phosphoribosyl 1,2-cyclic phosphodiesterase/CheY-like chemotaxis protein
LLTYGAALREAGFEVMDCPSGDDPLGRVQASRPHFLLAGGDVPDLSLAAAIRHQPELAATRILMLTADDSAEARARAFAAGADDCIRSHGAADELLRILAHADRFEATFWGIRGTIPVPGPGTLRYGGNTSCASLTIGHGRHFVFDAGTGLRVLSNRLRATVGGRFSGRLLISHPHWDHFNGLPFFDPLFLPDNHIVIHGPPQGERSLRDLIDHQLDGTFFPITRQKFLARVGVEDMAEGTYRLDGVQVAAMLLQHPGSCLAYRIDHRGHSFAYVPDNELGDCRPEEPYCQKLIQFLQGVDALVHDCTYFDDEYSQKVNWGHSTVSQAARLAHEAGARCLYLFHHDPDHDDAAIECKRDNAERLLAELGSSSRCRIAVEGESVRIDREAQ